MYFDDYRNAQQHKHSGFQPKPLATIYKEGNAGDCFSDTSSARTYLMELLDEMAGL